MMKLFDFHADTGYAVMKRRKEGMQDIITKDQLQKRLHGGFSWVCMASYFEGSETWEQMQEMIIALHEEIALCKDALLVKQKADLMADVPLHAICTVEGMCGIKEDVTERIDWLYDHDIKIASLAWNDENALATGVKGNPNRGLSELGIQAVKRMHSHRMIVDVSHANEKTFWDILAHCEGGVMATHSNARALSDHPRNLKDEQLIALAKQGGMVGVVCCGAFVHSDPLKKDIAHMVEHMRYLKDLIGIEHIALGLDFMDDYDGAMGTMLTDLNEPSKAQRIIAEMRNQGFDETQIRMIAYENALRYLGSYLS